MEDPTKDQTPAKNFEIMRLSYSSKDETIYCDGYIYGQEFKLEINTGDDLFGKFLPKHPPEYKFFDDDGHLVARIDSFNNFHSLLELFDGHVIHGFVHLDPILEELAIEYIRERS